MIDVLPNGALDPLHWAILGDDDLMHALRHVAYSEGGGYVRNAMTKCNYGMVRLGQAANLRRATPTCIQCLVA